MTTFPLRASALPNAPYAWPSFGRFGAFLASLFAVYADAEQEASAAQKRYLFASW